jgi:3-hydroxyisobutyrate dehydrogenase
MKLLFNAWIAALMEGVAEVSILGDALGIDRGRFASLVSGGPWFRRGQWLNCRR